MTSYYPRWAVVTAMTLIIGAAIGIASLATAAPAGPTVTLASGSASSTNSASIPVTAVFSEAVNGFATSSVSVTNGTAANFSGNGTSFTFNVIPTAQGAVTVTIPADMATSTGSGLGNQASNTLTFTSDTSAPVLTQTTGIASTTSDATPSYSFTSTEAGTLALSGGCTSPTTAAPVGTTTITFNSLANGSYSCSLSLTDAAGNTSNVLPITFAVNSGAPNISDVTVTGVSSSTATIMWSTDVPANSRVFYGTSSAYSASSTLNAATSTSHSVTLTNLSEGTVYHFQVQSANDNGTANSSDSIFVTQSTASSTPLAVTGIDTVNSQATADNTYEHGWKWVIHFTVPDQESAFRMRFTDFTNPSNSSTVPIANNLRIYSAQSSNASSSASAIVETSNAYGGWIYLTGDSGTTTPGRQIDLTVEVKVPVSTAVGGPYSTIFGANSTTTSATSTAP